MVLICITEDEIMHLGLDVAGFKGRRQQTNYNLKLKRFRSVFGPSPKTVVDIFTETQHNGLGEWRMEKPNAIYLLMTLSWLNTYQTEHNLAGTYGLNEKTVRRWIWAYTYSIQALKQKKVRTRYLIRDFIFQVLLILSALLSISCCLLRLFGNGTTMSQW
jgi:hypothetical protein